MAKKAPSKPTTAETLPITPEKQTVDKKTFPFRELKFQQLTQPKKAGEGLLDIPHPLILRYKSPDELVQQFEETWRMLPKGVILPVVVTDGVLYDCPGTGLKLSQFENKDNDGKYPGKYLGFEGTVSAFEKIAGIDKIYLSVDPTLQFVTTDGLHVEDIVGDGSQQVCIGNPRTQELLGTILGRGIDIVLNILDDHKKLTGAVIDTVDLWPQGADNDRLELTCFCESCQRYFDLNEEGIITKFKDFPNPWNLVLRDNKVGIGYIDNLPPDVIPQQIIALSRQKGYLEIFKNIEPPDLVKLAENLLSYIRIRHNQTVNALDNIFEIAFEGLDSGINLHRIVLLEGVHLDWTSGLQLKRLDEKKRKLKEGSGGFDEVWFNSTSPELFMENVAFRSYMWRRSRYLIDAFFQAVATATDPVKRTTTGIARWSSGQLRPELLLKRLKNAIHTSDSERTSLAALPPLHGTNEGDSKKTKSQRVGFVGVAFFSEKEGEDFIRDLEIPESGAANADILEAIRQLRPMSDKD